jgi:hypothetical protein
MRPEDLIGLLGQPASNPHIERLLARLKIRRRPQVELDPDRVDDPIVKSQDWLKNRTAGIELGFEDEATFKGDAALTPAKGPMLFTQVYFYGDHPEMKPYVDRLPFGLQLNEDRKAVRARLKQFESTRRSWVRDTWELPECRVTVSYTDDGARISFVLCALRVPPSATHDDLTVVPTIDELVSVLGRPMDDAQLRKVVKPLRIDRYLVNSGTKVIAVMREPYGLDLHFGGVPSLDASAFNNFFLYRDREADARGWPGGLPRGLQFDDSPEVVFRKMVRPADVLSEDPYVGYALWHFPEYSLQVQYSTIDNWIMKVQVLAPGVWASY